MTTLGASLTDAELREVFAADAADTLADLAGTAPDRRLPRARAKLPRFVRYSDADVLTLVVGEQEKGDVDTALAIGLGERQDRALRLVLPAGWHEPTLHRWAWLRDDLPLEVWSHDGTTAVTQEQRPARAETLGHALSSEDPQLHLGQRTAWAQSLMQWAGEQPDLDASHRRDVRAWQCRGQRVLRIKRSRAGLTIVGGIDWGATRGHEPAVVVELSGRLTSADEATLRQAVLGGMTQRLAGIARKADEHWLQAVSRRHPRELGLEQPVLRELPAWRPKGTDGVPQATPRGRGYVDLAGLDASGTLLLVETKLDGDHMLVLQGLDYRIWAEANRARLTQRLDCRTDVPIEIAYCVGGKAGGPPSWSNHTAAQLDALAPDLDWHVQEVTDWAGDGLQATRGAPRTFPLAP